MTHARAARPPSSRIGGRLAALVVALLVLVALLPSPAGAHGVLRGTAPRAGARLAEPPRELRLSFNERPELAMAALRLLDGGGRAVALGPIEADSADPRTIVAAIAERLGPGRYVVEWRIASRDGHPVRGTFAFTVAAADRADSVRVIDSAPGGAPGGGERGALAAAGGPPPDSIIAPAGSAAVTDSAPAGAPAPIAVSFDERSVLYVLVRWLGFVGIVLVIGALAWSRLAIRPADGDLADDARRRAARLAARGAALVLAVGFARLVAQLLALDYADHPFAGGKVVALVTHSWWGRGWLLHQVGALLAVLGAGQAVRAAPGARGGPWGAVTLGAVLLAIGSALGGHAAGSERWALALVALHAVHTLGAAAWVGGIVALATAGLPAALERPEGERGAAAVSLLTAFSPLALAGAATAALTGVVAGFIHLDASFAALWGTDYGRTLLVKLALVGLVAAIGAMNWRRFGPASHTEQGAILLRRTMVAEVGMAALVLLVTAVLVATAPGSG